MTGLEPPNTTNCAQPNQRIKSGGGWGSLAARRGAKTRRWSKKRANLFWVQKTKMSTARTISGTVVDGSNRTCTLTHGVHLHLPLGMLGFEFQRPDANAYKMLEGLSISLDAYSRFRITRNKQAGPQNRLLIGPVVDKLILFDAAMPTTKQKQSVRSLALFYMQPLLAEILRRYLQASPHNVDASDEGLKSAWVDQIWQRFFDQSPACVWQPADSKLWQAVQQYTSKVGGERQPASTTEFDRSDAWSIVKKFSTSQSIFRSFDVRWKMEGGARQRVSDVSGLKKNAMLREAMHVGLTGVRLDYDGLPTLDALEVGCDAEVADDPAEPGLPAFRPSNRWVCFGRVLLKAWIQSNTINLRISDVVLRAVKTNDADMPFKSNGELDATAFVAHLVGGIPAYATEIGACVTVATDSVGEFDEVDSDSLSLIALCESITTSSQSPQDLSLDSELCGRYSVSATDSTLQRKNESQFLNFVVAPRLKNILAIRYGFRSTYQYGVFVDIFSLAKLRYMLFHQSITAAAILEKLTWGDVEGSAAVGVKRSFETALGSHDATLLKQTAFYLFRDYNLAHANKIKVVCAGSDQRELISYSACAKTLSINAAAAIEMEQSVFTERLATIMTDLRYGEE